LVVAAASGAAVAPLRLVALFAGATRAALVEVGPTSD
jgi:hypothetical protein